MMRFLEDLASRRRFGMKPGLDTITALLGALGDPQREVKAIHIAGTNGKGAVAAMLDACLGKLPLKIGRYTSPHLVALNERFFLSGRPVDDETLDRIAARVSSVAASETSNLTFFEALTAVAFLLYAESKVDYAVLETGLGGRLDATNVCLPRLTLITKIGLDHCDWLGSTVEEIAAEKAGIIKRGVPIVLAKNSDSVRAVVEARAREVGAPFFYAPDLVRDDEIPASLSLPGLFNRENALTALAALKVLAESDPRVDDSAKRGLSEVVWPGRFQCVGSILVDGAHNPPAARALAASLEASGRKGLTLVFGACADKDVTEVLAILRPFVARGIAVKTNNPRSLEAEALAELMNDALIPSSAASSLSAALSSLAEDEPALVAGSLFLAGEALVTLGAYPWSSDRFDPSERLRA